MRPSPDIPRPPEVAPDAESGFSPGYRRYILGALATFYALNTMDRHMIGVLVQPIKLELKLTDGQIGALGGMGFALFYVTFGLLLSKLSDRHNRVTIISVCVAAWSIATAACGFATNFLQLLLARIGVAIGEAGGTPPAYSIISDLWPPAKRSSAMAIFISGGPLGGAIGILLAGWVNQLWGWRAAFVVLGLPGVLIALVMKLTIREPARGLSEGRQGSGEVSTVLDVARLIASRPAFIFMTLATALAQFTFYSLGVWLPAFFMRSYEMTSGVAGSWVAAINLFGAVGGSIVGGLLVDRLRRRDRRWTLWVSAIAFLIAVPFLLAAFLVHNAMLSIALIAVPHFLGAMYYGPVPSTVQALVGLRMRAKAVSIYIFVVNLIGLGLGPWVTGMLSDSLAGAGPEALRNALAMLLAPVMVVAAGLHFYAASKLRKDLDNAPP